MDPTSAYATAKKVQEGAKLGWSLWKWYQTVRYPKTKSGEIGIVVALSSEGEQVYNQIQNDLVHTLENLASSGNTQRPFRIISLSLYHQEKIKKEEDAENVLEKCRAKLVIWGQAKTRNINNKEYTVLEINAIASHGFLILPISKILGNEMRELLPARVLVPKENNLLEMEFSAVGMDLAAHYIVAVACFFSDDKQYSLELFQTLEKKLKAYDASALPERLKSHIILLRKKVVLNIATIYIEFSKAEHLKWRKTRENKALEISYDYALKAEAIIPGLYQTAIATSIYSFVVENDARKARKILEKWAANPDATWAFNMAFLHAFEENLSAASRFYKIALRRDTDSQVILEVEEFLEWVLENHPHKYQLHYSLGMMQFLGRDELDLGREHFNKFLAATPAGEFKAQVQEVQRYLDPAYKKPKTLA